MRQKQHNFLEVRLNSKSDSALHHFKGNQNDVWKEGGNENGVSMDVAFLNSLDAALHK